MGVVKEDLLGGGEAEKISCGKEGRDLGTGAVLNRGEKNRCCGAILQEIQRFPNKQKEEGGKGQESVSQKKGRGRGTTWGEKRGGSSEGITERGGKKKGGGWGKRTSEGGGRGGNKGVWGEQGCSGRKKKHQVHDASSSGEKMNGGEVRLTQKVLGVTAGGGGWS